MSRQADTKKRAKKSISGKLIRILLPMVAAAIIFIILFISLQARSIIIGLAQSALSEESHGNAQTIGGDIRSLEAGFDEMVDAIERLEFDSDEDIIEFMLPSLDYDEKCPNGMYIGLSDETYLDPSGWVPEEGWVATERDWYLDGVNHEKFTFGEPYLDSSTGDMIVTLARRVTLADGRTGVAAVDMTITGIVDEINAFKPMDTGVSMLLDGDFILSYYFSEYNGSLASEHTDDVFLNTVEAMIETDAEGVREITVGTASYYAVVDNIPGTSWTLISAVAESDVLAALNRFMLISAIVAVVVIALAVVVLTQLIRSIVTKPVGALTDNIERITQGDFTVEIPADGEDEIGTMNRYMNEYVASMRGTLGDMKTVTERLSTEADNSKNASNLLNQQANEQSLSMEQIHEAMDGVAQSVTELATNATDLATSVGELTEQGNATNEIMGELLEKARQGQQDMANVERSMGSISASMSEMNEVVGRVGDATTQINSIVDMINAISSQTNLLSLNASIEAARAGEAGRGFAVVADEIGALASQSAQATTEIGQIITQITQEIKDLSERSQSSMSEISASNEAVAATGATFGEIFSAVDETGATVRDMIGKMDEVNEIATSVAAIAEEQSASTEEVTATVDTAANSAANVAEESRGVDESANTVAESASRIEEFVGMFTIK